MSLLPVASELGAKIHDPSDEETGVALCFVLNKKYLTPFKVLCYSMIATGSFVRLPIIVISDSPEVFEDAFVRLVCDKSKLVSEDEKAHFRGVMAEKVSDVYRLDWIAKYTFLKWLMYDDWGYDKLLYIDSDMVFTRDATRFLRAVKSADFGCCPMFPLKGPLEELLQDETLDDVVSTHRSPNRYFNFLIRLFELKRTIRTARVNSGIQVVGPRLLNPAFRAALLKLATAKPFPNEQSVLSSFFKKNRDYKVTFVSPAYNFKSSFLDKLQISHALDVLSRVINIHYIGAAKPWLKPPTGQTSLSHLIWWKYGMEVAKNRRLFALPAVDYEMLKGAPTGPERDEED